MNAKRFSSKFLCMMLVVLSFIITLTACGKVEFKVNFVVDGAVYATVDTNGDEVIKMPTNPTKDGYTFDGWYWDKDTWKQPFTANSLLDAPLSSDMSVYAKFVSDEVPPTEAFIIAGLKNIPNIVEVEAATEYNDPNGQLNKSGGYIADIFFSVDIINQRLISGTTLVEKGTDAGGSIEVYRTAKDAETRNAYLGAFDGGILTSGSHKVVGTCVVRTSHELTASLQNILENNIEKMLTESTEAYVSMDSYLYTVAKQVAEKDNLSAYETATKLIELGYPLEKSEQIAEDCGVDFNNIAKKAVEGYADYYAMVSPLMVAELLADHEFTVDNISYAVQNANIDWEFYATRHAEEYVLIAESSNEYLTPNAVLVYLCWEKGYIYDWDDYVFDKSEYCQIALDNLEVNWNQKALEYIDYIEADGPLAQKSAYISELTGMDFTQAQAEYAVANCDINWNDRALYCVEHFVEDLSTTPPNHSQCIAKLKEWGFSDSEANYAVNNYDGLIYPDKLDYVITLNPNGGTVSTTTVNVVFGKSYTLPTPTLSGYTFKGWYNGSTQVTSGTWYIASNITLTAKWGETEYSINYNLDGGTNNKNNPSSYTTTQSVTLLAPTKKGHTFIGWKASGETTAVYSPTISKGSTENKTYTAVWSANTYTITFDANGGTCGKTTETVTYGQYYKPQTATRTGYSFNNWHYDTGKGYSEEYCNDYFTIDHDVTLVAWWNANNYTITYDVNGGTLSSTTQSVAYDSSYTLRTPTRTGYTFLGWYNGNTKAEGGTWKRTSGLTLKAKWQANTYKVTFAANGGNCDTTSLTATYDSSLTLPTPTRTGYTFSGWYDGSTRYYTGTWKTANAITLTAKWTARTDIPYVVNHYQENIYDSGYTLYASQDLTGTADSTIKPATNTYTGFTSPSKQTVTVNPDGSRVVNYYYTRNSYSITFVTNGGNSITKITQKYQSSLSVPDAVREDYTFGGWFTNATLTSSYSKPTTMPSTSRTLYAYWAEENKPGDFTYSGSSTITVSAYKGSSTTMWIPSYIGGKAVTIIPESAFKNNSTITKIVVPNTVTSIGKSAFYGCSALTDITLPFVGNSESTTDNYKQVFGYIFGYAESSYSTSTIYSNLTSESSSTAQALITYSSGTTYCMSYYIPKSIRNVTITKQTAIPDNAFRNCDLIETINIPTNTVSIGKHAFYNNKDLVMFNSVNSGEVIIPSAVTVLGKSTFCYCESITKVVLSDVIESLGDYAFGYCASLIEIASPNELTTLRTIGAGTFENDTALTKAFSGSEGEIIIPVGVGSIGEEAFLNNTLITKVVVSDTVISIGKGAFKGCSALLDITLPFVGSSDTEATNYKQVFGYIFGYAESSYSTSTIYSNLTSESSSTAQALITYSSGTTYCMSYYIPKSIRNVTITKQTAIPDNAFRNCDLIETINIPTNTISIGDYAFYWCTNVESYNDGYLPETIIRISDYAFYNNDALVELNISSQIESVGNYAFYGSDLLSKVSTISSVSTLTDIGEYAFAECDVLEYLFVGEKGEIVIPNNVLTIGKYAFAKNTLITKVVIPNTVNTIGVGAFKNCSTLEDITLPFVGNSETADENYMQVFGYIFGYETSSSSASSIYTYLTSESNSYTSQALITYSSGTTYCCYYFIPESIRNVTITRQTVIPDNAFRNCDLLETINIPVNTVSIGKYAFYRCSNVESYNDGLLPETLTHISEYAFYNNDALVELNISSQIESIGNYAFYGSDLLSKVSTKSSVSTLTSIGEYAFGECDVLEYLFDGVKGEIVIPNNVLTIGNYAFEKNTLIRTVVIPNTVISIGVGAFKNCSTLEDITLPFVGNSETADENYMQVFGYIFGYETSSSSASSIYTYLTSESNSYTSQALITYSSGTTYCCYYLIPESIRNVTITKQTLIPDNAFRNCDLIESIVIPSNTSSIGDYAFYNTKKLTSIDIPKSSSIGTDAFVNSGLINKTGIVYIGSVLYKYNGTMPSGYTVRVKDGTTSIQSNAFSGCSGLTTLILPEGLKSIGSNAFKNCTSLKEVVIPSSVESIGSSAFYGCSALTKITIPFVGTSKTSTSSFSTIFGTVPTSLTTVVVTGNVNIPANAFKNCTKLTTITFTGEVEEIGANAFYGCSALTTLILPNTVTSIGNYVFYGCSKLTSIDLGSMSELMSLGSYAFQNCTSITSIVIPETVTMIADYTFSGCTKLASVSMSSKTTGIGNYAFNGCSSLTTITLNSDMLESIGAYAFQNCSSLVSIYIPNSVNMIGEYAFNGCTALTINCGAFSLPDDWDYNWNPSNCVVAWGK